MTMFRVRADGYFMGSFLKKDQVIDIHDKQAKYAILSGQLQYVYPPAPKAKKKAAPMFSPKGMVAPPPKKVVDESGEFSMGRRIGGSLGGNVRK